MTRNTTLFFDRRAADRGRLRAAQRTKTLSSFACFRPNVIDRLIQQAILQVLTPIFDPGFSESSFGFRPGRSAQEAAKQVQSYIRAGYRHCVDMDLSKFFD